MTDSLEEYWIMKKTRWFSVLMALVLFVSALMPAAVAGDSEPAEEPAAEQAQQSVTSAEEATVPAEPEAIIAEQSEPAPAEEEITVIPPAEEEAPVADEEPEEPAQEDPVQEEPESPVEQLELSEEMDQEAGILPEENREEVPEVQPESGEELPEEQAVPSAEEADQPAAFEKGYVLIRKQTAAYRNPDKKNVLGTFTADSVAWAVRTTANEDPAKVWLKITFDTEDARKTGTPLFVGYIQQAAVTVLTEEEAGQLSLRLQADPETREENAHGIPVAGFELKQSAGGETAAPADSKKEEKPGKLAANDGSAGDPEETELKVSVTSVIKKGIGTQVTLAANVAGRDESKEIELCWEVSKDNGATWSPAAEDAEFTVAGNGAKLVFTIADRFYDTYRIRCKVRYQESAGEEPAPWVTGNEATFVQPFAATVSVSPAKAAIGEKVTYTVVPGTTGNLTYQWQLSTNNGKTWKNMKNKTGKTITRTIKDFEYGYRYRCLVTKTNSKGVSAQINSAVGYAKRKYTVKVTCSDLAPGLGTIITMDAAVSGAKGTLSYQWQCSADNGKTWTAATNSGNKTATMKVKIQAANFGMQYRCLVKASTSGQVNSYAMTVTQPHTPVIAYQGAAAAGIGEWLEMKAETDQQGTLQYIWQVSTDQGATWANLTDDETVMNSRGAVLSVQIDPDGLRYTYQYRCVVSVDGKKVVSGLLGMKKPLSVSVDPSPAAVGIGATETLTAVVGNEFIGTEYRWQISTDQGQTWSAYGSDTASDTVSVTVEEEQAEKAYSDYRIRCLVTAAKGGRTVTVNTDAVPFARPYTVAVTANPADQKAGIGKKVRFTAAAEGVNGESYQWQYSTDKGKTWTDLQDKTAQALYVQVTETFNYDTYRYRCRVTDPVKGAVYSDGKASVKRPYSVTLSESSAVLSEGATKAFTVKASGTVQYEWQYSENGGDTWTVASGDTGYKTKSITLKADTAHYQRLYRCKLTVSSVSTYSPLLYIDPVSAQYYTFKEHGQYWDVSAYSGSSSSIKIPAGHQGRKVVRIDVNTFKGNVKLKKAVIPKSVTAIGASAFEGCTALATVVLSDNVKAIGKAAFKNCSSLTNMEISNK